MEALGEWISDVFTPKIDLSLSYLIELHQTAE